MFFIFEIFRGFLPLLDSTVEIDRKLADTQRKREGGGRTHATKASGRLKPWTLQLQEVRLLTNGAQGGTSWNVSETIVSRHEHHLLSSHLSPLPTLRFDCTVHKLLCCCCFFLLNFYSWSNQLKKKFKNEVLNSCKCTKFD